MKTKKSKLPEATLGCIRFRGMFAILLLLLVFIGSTKAGWVTSGNNMYSDVSGNVGIGTENPSAKLDVTGHINSSESYKLNGASILANPGRDNAFVGVGAGASNTIGSCNTFLGGSAGYSNTTGFGNTFLGGLAGYANTEGFYNTFLGYRTGESNTTGYYNTFLGVVAGCSNTEGYQNTFSGHMAGCNNTTGFSNTFLGYQAGYSNTTGIVNTFLGDRAGYANTEGSYNTFSGYAAGSHNTTGYNNAFSGSLAGTCNNEGNNNTFSGYGAGNENTTGSCNTFLGSQAGAHNETGNNNVFIGYYAGLFENGSNKLYIANGQYDRNVLIYGDFSTGRVGLGTKTLNYRLQLPNTANTDGQGQANAWVTYSSRRWKTNIQPIENALEKVQGLTGVYFDWKSNGKHDIGLIAEEVAEVIPEVVGYEEDGKDASSLDYSRLVALLVEAIKEQQCKITELEATIAQRESVEQRLEALERKMGQDKFAVLKEVQ